MKAWSEEKNSGWGGGSVLPLVSTRPGGWGGGGHVIEADNTSRCQPDDYEV